MRRTLRLLGVTVAMVTGIATVPSTAAVPPAVPANGGRGAGAADPRVGGFMSPNVTWVGTLPIDSPGVGGRVLTVKGQVRFYVTGVKGLSIWDVTNPAVPLPIGELAHPHFENESVAVSDDGSLVVLASDPGFGQPPLTYLVDTSIPQAPHVVGVLSRGTHTATCADPKCDYLYASDGWIADLRNRSAPKVVGDWGGSAHYLNRDASGLLSTGTALYDPRRNPLKPKRVTVKSGGWHNSLRPNAERWRPRRAGDRSPVLRPGELHLGGDETWLAPPACGSRSASITSWSITDFDKGRKARKISEIRPRNGEYVDGDPAANVLGCSSHWFDYRRGVIAAGWYDHGIRFVSVDERTGVLTEAGYFQPVVTEAWAAYWVSDEYVYTVDAVRGVDILRFSRTAPRPAEAELDRSWPRPQFPRSAATTREQYVCRRAAERSR